MTSLALWIAAGMTVLILPSLGVPFPWSVVVAAPFAALAGWLLVRPPLYRCGCCGRQFTGPYDWCCPGCGEEPLA